MPKYVEKQFKTIINRLKYIDSWFWCRYTTNPYSGCQHACIYCDARSNRYYLHQDFEETIYVKKNAAKILENKIKSSRTMLRDVVASGGVCDAYQQAEKEFENTRKMLEIFHKYKFPVCLSTKSDLIERDLDIYNDIANDTWCSLGFTITSMDQEVVNFLEPRTSSPENRLRVIKKISQKYPKIEVGVNYMPIIPFLEDSDESIEMVIKSSKEAGAKYILFSAGMTFRDNQGEFFIKKLKERYPDIVQDFLNLYKGNMMPNMNYLIDKTRIVLKYCEKYKMKLRAKRWIPKDYRKMNYIIAEVLLNDAYNKQIHGKSFKSEQWAGLHIQNLKESIVNINNRDKLTELQYITPKIAEKIKPYLKGKSSGTIDSYW
ncbi:MAG: radical SAM protein [archaeon]|nr:radical SAM protein [archaeon]